MERIFIFLVVLAVTACSFSPFDLSLLPKTVHIDPAFTEMEHEIIFEKIEMTNRELGSLLGYDILILGDPLHDPDGFTSDGSDMGDDVHGIYRLLPSTEAYKNLSCLAGRGFGGYATLQDVLMIHNLDLIPEIDNELLVIEGMEGWEEDEELSITHQKLVEFRADLIGTFRRIMAHELGHHIGLAHNPLAESLMFPGPRDFDDFQSNDKAAFCLVRGCTYP